MKLKQYLQRGWSIRAWVLGLCLVALAPSARANVYATNIKLNDSLTNVTVLQADNVNITYLLNEPASSGVTLNILSGTNVVRTLTAAGGGQGALRGLNTVVWDGKANNTSNALAGTYSVSIVAATAGYTNWTQISDENNPTSKVFDPRGIAVDRNPTSPYFGRIFIGNSASGPDPAGTPGDAVGLYKVNADGSAADEGGYTTGGYAWPGLELGPLKIEVSADDFVYVNDQANGGDVYRWDPTLSPGSLLYVLRQDNRSPNSTLNGPFLTGSGTNTQLWMADTNNLGVLRWNLLADGTCLSNNLGTTVVGVGGSLNVFPSDVALDSNGNIYTCQSIGTPATNFPAVLCFSAYNPATNGGAPELTATWMVGAGDTNVGRANGVAVDPTGAYLAVACRGEDSLFGLANGNTRILATSNGTFIATLDLGLGFNGQFDTQHEDTDCAWDAVGNVYYTDNEYGVWRAFSPPGTNQATTIALPTLEVIVLQPSITDLTVSNGMIVITFTASHNDVPSEFTVLSSLASDGPFSVVPGATIVALSPGVFQATAPSGGVTRYYRIGRLDSLPPVLPQFSSLSVANGTVTLNFGGAPTDSASAFTLLRATNVAGAYVPATGVSITNLSPGVFRATVPASGPMQFYRIRR
jgi:hypothetical protein